MNWNTEIDGSEDVLDSRDVIARAEHLAETLEDDGLDEDEQAELRLLQAFVSEGESHAVDWSHGCILVRDSYMMAYCKAQVAECGMEDFSDRGWPYNCLEMDWDSALEQFQQDYSIITFGDVNYWASSV